MTIDDEARQIDGLVDVICDGDKIEIAFGRALLSGDPSTAIGKPVTVKLTNVRDLAYNKAQSVQW